MAVNEGERRDVVSLLDRAMLGMLWYNSNTACDLVPLLKPLIMTVPPYVFLFLFV